MSRPCPQGSARCNGYLHPSRDYPSLLLCNFCGRYYARQGGTHTLRLIEHERLSGFREAPLQPRPSGPNRDVDGEPISDWQDCPRDGGE